MVAISPDLSLMTICVMGDENCFDPDPDPDPGPGPEADPSGQCNCLMYRSLFKSQIKQVLSSEALTMIPKDRETAMAEMGKV